MREEADESKVELPKGLTIHSPLQCTHFRLSFIHMMMKIFAITRCQIEGLKKGLGTICTKDRKWSIRQSSPFHNVLCIALQRFIKYSKDVSQLSRKVFLKLSCKHTALSTAFMLQILVFECLMSSCFIFFCEEKEVPFRIRINTLRSISIIHEAIANEATRTPQNTRL